MYATADLPIDLSCPDSLLNNFHSITASYKNCLTVSALDSRCSIPLAVSAFRHVQNISGALPVSLPMNPKLFPLVQKASQLTDILVSVIKSRRMSWGSRLHGTREICTKF